MNNYGYGYIRKQRQKESKITVTLLPRDNPQINILIYRHISFHRALLFHPSQILCFLQVEDWRQPHIGEPTGAIFWQGQMMVSIF